jgi:type II secretory pathway pseudopilin PulG
MKQCPACYRTYADDALLFCLEDGTQLVLAGQGGGAASTPFDPNATLALSSPRDTNPPPDNFYPQAPPQQMPAPPTWSPTPYNQPGPPAQKSSARAWIIGAVAAVIVLGIGIVVLLAIIGKDSQDEKNKNANRTVVSNANNANSNRANANNTNRGTVTAPSTVLKDDFTTENWPTGDKAYGSFYEDGEYHMKGRPKLYVFMFPINNSADDLVNYSTKDATVKVTARSVDGKSPEYGYGLIAHGKVNPKGNLDGYGFLIYTGQTPMYEIVRFVDGEPTDIVKWTQSSVIRGGTNSNQIEVRTKGSQLSMYVNGQFLNSITDTANYAEGYVGLYTSETNEVAFDDMEIRRETMKAAVMN